VTWHIVTCEDEITSPCTTFVGRAAASRIVLEDKGGGGLVFVGAIRETPRDGGAMGGDLLAIVSSDSPIATSPIGSRGWVRGLDTDRRASARCRGEITRSTRAITGCALALRAAWRRDREGGESGTLREVWRTVRPRRRSTGFAKGARRVLNLLARASGADDKHRLSQRGECVAFAPPSCR
jgi:hypothetical protein